MKIIFVLTVFTYCVLLIKNEPLNMFNICGTTLHLEDFGLNSSLQINLTLIKNMENCKINLIAPQTHLLYIRLVDNNTENFVIENNQLGIERDQIDNNEKDMIEKLLNINQNLQNFKPDPSKNCILNIYQPELSKNPSFTTNPCSNDVIQDGTLLGNKAMLEYLPKNISTHKWVLVTAVGAGEICFNPQMHSCWQQGLTPLLCISKYFLCDGVVHCPTGGFLGDENIEICKSRSSTNWEKLANDLLKKFTTKNKGLDTLLPAIQKGEKRWSEHFLTTTQSPYIIHPKLNSNSSNQPAPLNQFGPWSYLMLGMLICGTVLTFCGLWECCCRKNKLPTTNHLSDSPSVTSQPANSSAVLVMTSQPPKYDELDQPPSYKILFPEKNM